MTELTRRNALGAAAALGVAVPALAACGSDEAGPGTAIDTTTGSPTPTTPPPSSSPAAPGALAATSDIPVGGGVIFKDDGVVVTQPEAGTFHGFTITCTHEGCLVNSVSSTINCPCHGSKYSIDDGSVVTGPATASLTDVPLKVKGGNISKA